MLNALFAIRSVDSTLWIPSGLSSELVASRRIKRDYLFVSQAV